MNANSYANCQKAIKHFLAIYNSNHSQRELDLAIDALKLAAGGVPVVVVPPDETLPGDKSGRKSRQIVAA